MITTVNNANQILNKRININYNNAFFSFVIDENKKISWILKNGNDVVNQTSNVFVKQVNDNVVVLEWMNQDNTIVSKEINLENNTVDCVFYNNEKTESFTGKIFLNQIIPSIYYTPIIYLFL